MCVTLTLKVTGVRGKTAQMEDGRIVRLGSLSGVRLGDYLDVYADVAIGKLDSKEVQSIRKAQKGGIV